MATEYWIDAQDVLVDVNQEWCDFAIANDSEHMLPPLVLGKSLWDFFDIDTETIYRLIFDRIRGSGISATFRLRCDSPRLRRQIQMTLAPQSDRRIHLACAIVAQHEIQFDPATPCQLQAMLRVCSWCNRVALSDELWVDIERAVPSLSALERYPAPRVTHGICGDCQVRMAQEIAKLDALTRA